MGLSAPQEEHLGPGEAGVSLCSSSDLAGERSEAGSTNGDILRPWATIETIETIV